jgi:hypothetical protein
MTTFIDRIDKPDTLTNWDGPDSVELWEDSQDALRIVCLSCGRSLAMFKSESEARDYVNDLWESFKAGTGAHVCVEK